MNTTNNPTIVIDAVYVSHLVGISAKNGRPYNFMEVSNGIEKVSFSTDLPESATADIAQGESIQIEIEPDCWNPRKTKIVSIN